MRAHRLILALLLVALVSGCAGVPGESAPVVIGPATAGGAAGNGGIGVQPGGPDKDASTDEIVRGFIRALTTTDPTYQAAREFLDPEVATSWSPSAALTLIDPAYAAQPTAEEGRVSFIATRTARVDGTGRYVTDPGPISYEYVLREVDGQWRITNPPDQILIDRTSFGSVYSAATLYFANPTGTTLVPDVRYFRTNIEQRANVLIEGLIKGPSPGLRDGVRNELDEPVKLRSGVSLGANPVTIDLTGVEGKSEQQLRVMSAQIMWTLRDVRVASARILSDGKPIDLPGIGEIQTRNDWESFDPNEFPVNARGYYLNQGAVLGEKGEPVAGPLGTGELAVTAAAISVDGTVAAVVSGAVLRAGPIAAPTTLIDLPGTGSLSAPTWGGSNDEFLVARNGAEIVRVPLNGAPKIVAAPSPETYGQIRAISASRDGARLAIIAGPPDGPGHLYVATIVRTADSVSLGPLLPLAGDLNVSAVTWADARTIAFLGQTVSGPEVAPYTVLIDDSNRESVPRPVFSGEPTALAAAPNRLLLCAGDATVRKLEDSTWVSLIPGATVNGGSPFYPG